MTPDALKLLSLPEDAQASALRYWQRVRLLTGALLLAWGLASFGFVFYARELSTVKLLGTPLPFYMAAQGTILIYLAIIGAYAFAMKQLDALADKSRNDDDGE
jgi:putative solute:sodium symporter small subunit